MRRWNPRRLTKTPTQGLRSGSAEYYYLKRKSFYVMVEADAELMFTPELVNETAKAFRTAAKLNRFVTDALDLAF